MDATMTAPITASWELLAQLALYGQQEAEQQPLPGLTSHVGELLQRYLPVSSGLLAIVEGGNLQAHYSWGFDALSEPFHNLISDHTTPLLDGEPAMRLPLQANGEQLGVLLLSRVPGNGHVMLDGPFYAALAAQLGLVLFAQRRSEENRLETELRQLIDANLELVGLLDIRTLLQGVLSQAATMLGYEAMAVYQLDEAENRLVLQARSNSDFPHPEYFAPQSKNPISVAAANHSTQVGQAERAARRRAASSAPETVVTAVPLLGQEQALLGVLACINPADQVSGLPHRMRLTEAFATQVALLNRNARLFSQQQQRARELFVLYENSQEINTSTQLDALLDRASENIALALQADHCLAHFVEPEDGDRLHLVASYSEHGRTSSEQGTLELYIADAGSFLAQLPQSEPVFIEDVATAAATNPLAAAVHSLGCRSAILLPLRGKNTTVGLLTVGYSQRNRRVTQAERNLAQVLANQLATAIVNRRLSIAEQQRAAELEQLQGMSYRLNSDLDLDEAQEAILDGLDALIPFAGARIYLFDAGTQQLQQATQRGLDFEARDVDSLTSWLVRHSRSLRIDDLQQAPVPLREGAANLKLINQTPARSYLGVPLRVGDEPIGTLELVGARTNGFSSDNERLLTIVAGQAAQALANARRFEQADSSLRSRVEQLRALQRVSSQLAITLNQNEILQFVIEQALKGTGATHGLIALRQAEAISLGDDASDTVIKSYFSSEGATVLKAIEQRETQRGQSINMAGDTFVIVEAVGYDRNSRELLLQTPLTEEMLTASEALKRREPELTDMVSEEERFATVCPTAASALAAPIFYQAGVVGVVLLLAPNFGRFDHDAIEFLRALTHQAAVGIGNAQRRAELEQVSTRLQRRAAILNDVLEIGQALRADRSLENLLEQVGYSAMESANFRVALFCLVDSENSRVLRAVAGAGIPLNELDRMRKATLDERLALRYLDSRFRMGRCYFVPGEEAIELERGFDTSIFDYNGFSDPESGEVESRDRVFVPLYSTEGRLLGLMMVEDPLDGQTPTRRSVEPLEIYADQAAIAIENAYLLGDARARAEQMTALFQVGSAATSTVGLDELLERVYQEIVAYLETPSFFYIAIYNQQNDQITFELFKHDGEIWPEHHKTTMAKVGLTSLIIDQGQSLLIQDLKEPGNTLAPQALLWAENVRSWLGVPLLSQNRVIGVLSVQDVKPNAFSERDQQFLLALANQLAIAIERATLFSERERRLAELAAINRIGTLISSTLDLPQMLDAVYQALSEFLTLDAFFIFVYREEENQIVLSLEVDEGVKALESQPRIPSSGSLTERIIRTRQPLHFHNLAEERLTTGVVPFSFGNVERKSASWLGVPMIVGDNEVVGVISVQSYTPGVYGDQEREFITTVASQLALGVQNAQLLARAREQVEQLRLVNRVSLVATETMDHQRIYQEVVNALAQVTGVDQARLVLYDRKAGVAPVVAEYKPTEVGETLLIQLTNNPAVDWLDKEERPLISEDAQTDPLLAFSHQTFAELDIRSIALVPMIVNGEVIGCIGLDFVGRQGYFSPSVMELCVTIANQTATAIVNAQLFASARENAEKLRIKLSEQSTLLDAARILSSLLQPEEVLNKLMELVARQLSVTTVALWTITADNMLVPAAMDGISVKQGNQMRVPVGQGFTGRVAESGMPLIIDDVDVSGGSLYPNFQRKNNLISYMGVPVIYRERTIGVLSVMTNHRREFSDDEMMLLVGLADQAATALENARLFQERERRIRELTTIDKIATSINSTLDEQDMIERLHRGISEIVDVSTSGIVLFDERRNMLHYPVGYDQGQRVTLTPLPFEQATGTSGWVIRNRQPLLIGTFEEAVAMGLNIAHGINVKGDNRVEQSYLVVPIIFGNKILGAINIQSYEQRAFDENDLRFLTTVASQAATALNNVRLFSETRQNAQEMATLFEITQNLSSTLDVDETQDLIADSAMRLLGVDMCAVLRLDYQGRIERQTLFNEHGAFAGPPIPFRADGMTAHLRKNDRPIVVEDLEAIPDANPAAIVAGVRAVLGVPIGTYDERVGVLWVGYDHPHAWSDHQISLISILANQAAQALKSARLFEAEQARRRMADTLRDVAQSFTSTLALREIQTLILEQLARVVDYDSAAVMLRDEGYGHLQITESRGLDSETLLHESFEIDDHPLFARMALERQPLLLTDALTDQRFARLARLGWQARGWIGAPLLVDNELVGVLAVGSNQVEAYDREAVEVTFALASQVSQAIQNARLFDEITNLATDLERRVEERTADLEYARTQVSQEKERLEAVHAITIELTAILDLDLILVRALELVSKNMGVSRGSIILRDTENGDLICRAVLYSQGEAHTARIRLSFNGGQGLAGWAMQHQEAVCIGDVRQDARWVQEAGRADEVRSVAAVPLKAGDTAMGVLILSSPHENFFTDSQMNLLGTIANVVASAINNAQLYSFINELATNNAVLFEEQREETSKNQAILQSVTEGVIVLDQSQRIKLFNPAAEQVLEIPARAMLGQPIDALADYGQTEAERRRAQLVYNGLISGLKQVAQSQSIYSTSLDLNDPTQVIAVNMAAVIGPGGLRYGDVAVLRDITREIEADQAKRQFISDVSHELRTPLTSINGYVDVLRLSGTTNLGEDQVSYLNIIKSNTNRLRALIEDILDFTRPDGKAKLNFSQVDMTSVIEDVVQSLRLEAERKQMTVMVQMAENLPLVTADQRRITQVVFNLFSNAVKYTFEGGKIQVRLFLNPSNMMQIDVEDTGVGMTPEQVKKLFRPFYRADNPLRDVAGGTGLGLSIAKQFVEQHGGEMWVNSEHGKGSTFSFIIPLKQTETKNGADEDYE
jgi:GAF domain-containing protein/anti-sigma regulatory factor (Ser/Thr protein kinase)